MDGKAVNGWRFWTVEGDEPAPAPETEKPAKKSRGKKKQMKTVLKTPRQDGAPAGKTGYFCCTCMKGFYVDEGEEVEACPEGHRNDDPELNAPSGIGSAEEAG
jgi:hypothetical protein